MKYVVFVLFSLIIGIAIGASVYYWQHKSVVEPESLVTPVQQKPLGTAFSMEQAPLDSLRGTVTELTGIPYWESRTATEPVVLLKDISIQQGEKIIASDSGSVSVSFAAAGSISLSPESEIEIIQTLPVNLVFSQKKGNVSYAVSGSSPVSVRSFHLLLNIPRGNVHVSVDDSTETVTVNVIEGNATIAFNSLDYVSQTISITSGQTLYYSDVIRGVDVQ